MCCLLLKPQNQVLDGRLREQVMSSPAVLLLPEPEAVEAQLQASQALASSRTRHSVAESDGCACILA